MATNHREYTVGWICALPIEMANAKAMLDEQYPAPPQPKSDDNNYAVGKIGAHKVVIACLPTGRAGTTSAAVVATQMLSTFTGIRFGLMVGVGGGVPSEENDVRLGDVVICKPTDSFGGVIQDDHGKTVLEDRIARTGSLNGPPNILLNALSSLQSNHLMGDQKFPHLLSKVDVDYPKLRQTCSYPGSGQDKLFKPEYPHPEDKFTCAECDDDEKISRTGPERKPDQPLIRYGLIASGNQDMMDGITRKTLRKELYILCFDREAAGLMNTFPCLVIRGIYGYADSHQNRIWQPYAAATAAAYAKELLCIVPVSQVTQTRTATEVMRKHGEWSQLGA